MQGEQRQSGSASSGSDGEEHKTERLTGTKEGGEDLSYEDAGEDDGSTSFEGEDNHLNDDQKPTTK